MNAISVHDAEVNLAELIERVEHGEEIVISRDDKPVARLVAVEEMPRERKPGMFKGQFEVGPAFFEPLPPEELELWE